MKGKVITMEVNNRINRILCNTNFIEHLKKNNGAEKNRQFCKHDINHLLDVARLAYIMVLEKDLDYSKDIIYAAALLHDIGRWLQYKENIPHEKASAKLAKEILEQSDYDSDEIELICNAILNHRNQDNESTLNYIIYKSDKLSRKCYHCTSIHECNWSEDKKNYKIAY